VRFLEAQHLLRSFRGGEPLPLLVALSGSGEPLELYVRAAAAQRGRTAEVRFLAFNTLAQALRADPDSTVSEVLVLLPWDFVPEADWRLGVPETVDEESLRARAGETAELIGRRTRTGSRVLYLPAPLPPLFADPPRNNALARFLESLALGLGARPLPADVFALGSYLASGCPIGGGAIGDVAEIIVDTALTPRAEHKKVLVTDLDNVVWSGVIADDGLEGIAFESSGPGYRHFVYQSLLRRLRREGALLAAVSRNDGEVAAAPFRSGRMVLREADFVAFLGSYYAKSAQIRALAERLNLGLDGVVFVDDNPVELAEVSLRLPDVRCLAFPQHDEELPAFLTDLAGMFAHGESTPEDRERTELYQRRLAGLVPSDLAGADLTRFLQDLKMVLSIHDRSQGDRTRAVQLINKTNQFNLNGRRVTDGEVAAILDAGGRLFAASLADRTGSHGEILACLVSAEDVIVSLVMSCRVFQRRVEYAFFSWFAAQRRPPLGLEWAKTPRNAPLQQFLEAAVGPVNGAGVVPLDSAVLASAHAGDLALFTVLEPPSER